VLQLTGGGLHLPHDQYRSMPWRNGSGITREIVRDAGAGDGAEFSWRLSLASITASGAFSNYAGYRRSVTLIAGKGFRLDIGSRQPVTLDTVGATALFPGAVPTGCVLIDGPCSDLSLMVREPGSIISVSRISDTRQRSLPLVAGAMKALFCLTAGALRIHTASPTPASQEHAELQLDRHDSVLMGPQSVALSVPASGNAPLDLLLLTWRPASPGPPRDNL
jgi:environmental stress-induced protein Ves